MSSDELVDIVDEYNNAISQATKQKAHEEGLLHRTVISEVKTSKGEWLLVKQSPTRQDAGQYVSPVGGHVGAGESEEDALKREAWEELGLKNFTHKYVGKAIFNRTVLDRRENHYFIVYEIYSDDEPTLNYESERYDVFTPDQLKKELNENSQKFGAAFYFVVKTFYPQMLL